MADDQVSGALPYGLEHIEGIADRLREVLYQLKDANRSNYPLMQAWAPGPLQQRFMEAIDGLFDAEAELAITIQEIHKEQRRRISAGR